VFGEWPPEPRREIFFMRRRPGVFAVALAIQYYGCDETADFPMD
jgi:hypothetical protein